MKLKKWIMDRIFGGRPMKETGFRGVDLETGKKVYTYIDKRGRKWLANRGRTLKREKRHAMDGKLTPLGGDRFSGPF